MLGVNIWIGHVVSFSDRPCPRDQRIPQCSPYTINSMSGLTVKRFVTVKVLVKVCMSVTRGFPHRPPNATSNLHGEVR